MTPRPPAKSQKAIQVLAALKRAGKVALETARQNGTPCYVEIDGKIVDIAAKRDVKQKSKQPATKKK